MKFLSLLALFFICQGIALLAAIKTLCAIFFSPDRAWHLIVSYDRLANATINGNGKETISSRAQRGTEEGNKSWCILCKLLDRIEKDHCLNSKDI